MFEFTIFHKKKFADVLYISDYCRMFYVENSDVTKKWNGSRWKTIYKWKITYV